MPISVLADDESLHDELVDEFSDAAPEEIDGDSTWGFLGGGGSSGPSKRRFGRHKEDKAPKARATRKKNLTSPVTDGLTTLGGILTFVRPITGVALIDRAPLIADALNDIAKDNDALYKFLERMTTGGKWGTLATASFPVICAAYVETTGGQGMLGSQATMIMANGLSDKTMEKILGFMEKEGI